MYDSFKKRCGFLCSLPALFAPPGPALRGGLPGVAAAAGLALLLTACGGGGAVAQAPATPPQTETPPTETPPTEVPPVVEDAPPREQTSPPPPTPRITVTDPSMIPFPSGSPVTDKTVNANTFGIWGLPAYQSGGSHAADNNGPDVMVRRRVGYAKRVLSFPGSGSPVSYGTAAIADLWLTYPAGAGDGDLAVHVRTRRATPGGYGSISDDAHKEQEAGGARPIGEATGLTGFNLRGTTHKGKVKEWLEAAAQYGFSVEDFFLTETYLQAPGSAVQPAAQGSETSATWTGKVIAVDSAAGSIQVRGTEIGGDATVTVNFGNSPTVDVWLTNLRSARSIGLVGGKQFPTVYPRQTWRGLRLSGGGFSDSSAGRTISGVFRNQGTTAGTNANTAGGLFDVHGTMKGGFAATFGN